jgi:hypothetical protein
MKWWYTHLKKYHVVDKWTGIEGHQAATVKIESHVNLKERTDIKKLPVVVSCPPK